MIDVGPVPSRFGGSKRSGCEGPQNKRVRIDAPSDSDSESDSGRRSASASKVDYLNFGRCHGRGYSSGEDNDHVYTRRPGSVWPGQFDDSRKIEKVVDIKSDSRDFGIYVIFDKQAKKAHKERVEHFDLKDSPNGPDAFCPYLATQNNIKRFRIMCNERKKAFIKAIVARAKEPERRVVAVSELI